MSVFHGEKRERFQGYWLRRVMPQGVSKRYGDSRHIDSVRGKHSHVLNKNNFSVNNVVAFVEVIFNIIVFRRCRQRRILLPQLLLRIRISFSSTYSFTVSVIQR